MPVKRTKTGWEISVCVNYRRVHRRLPASASAGDAKRLEADIRSALGKREPSIPGDPRLTDLMALYMAHAETLRGPEPAKYAALRIGPWVEGHRASEARFVAATIQDDMAGYYRPATINKSLGTLKKALRMAYRAGKTPTNYGDGIQLLPEDNMRDVTLTIAQVQKLADCASEQLRAAIWIALYSGARRGEICAIKAENIGPDTIILPAGMTKTLRTRSIPIIPPLRPWLKFLPLKITPNGIHGGFRNARVAAGMPWATFHDIRRSTATILLAVGTPMHVISKLLGHSSTRVTESRYAHLQVDAMRAALESAFTKEAA
jgi:integrase